MADPTYDAVGPDLVAELTDFTFALRLAGLPVTIEGSMNFLRAVASLNTHDQVELFWAGRTALCCEPGDFDVYDETFNWFFRQPVPAPVRSPIPRRAHVRLVPDLVPPPDPTASDETDSAVTLPDRTAPVAGEIPAARNPVTDDPELVRHEDLADLTDDERAELAALLRLLDAAPAERRSSFGSSTPRGQLDPVRALRSVFRGGGEVGRRRKAIGARPRKLVLLLDTSGSMAPFAEPLLEFAHAARRKLGTGCEVFTLGNGLTRLSDAFGQQDLEQAVDAVGRVVPAWTGGTRLGQALRAFLDQHGQRGMARGAVVIVVSDGHERGNAELLIEQARRLRRLSRSFIWVNPHRAHEGFAPVHRGILAVQPFCDHLFAGHSLTALSELMDIAHDA